MKHMTMIVIALGLIAGCKKTSEATDKAASGQSAKPSEGADPAVAKDMPAPFAAWDLAARAKAWQGAWITEEMAGSPIALEIKGTAATVWDGTKEKHLELSLASPCSAKLTENGPDGSMSSTITSYTLKAGKLVAGLGDAGSRKGKQAIACVSNAVLTLDDAGTCIAWSSHFGKWKSEPGTCAITQKDGKDVFTAKVDGMDEELLIDGDAILSEQLAGKSAQSFADFAAAKAARK